MKVLYKNKILINGLFPMVNFNIDGYKQKTGKYDETIINTENEDFIFYSAGYLVQSMYSVKDKTGSFYEYFENEEFFEIEVAQIEDKKELEEELLEKISLKVQLLEKKLRLITNLKIGLPIFKAVVYDENREFITFVGEMFAQSSLSFIFNYDEKMKELLQNRLKFSISDESLLELESKNLRYQRAITFFLESFVPVNRGVRFTLLFSALESLFNINGESATETVAKYSSKILFLNPKGSNKIKMKIKDYYDIRSLYIHGNEPRPITEKNEFDLRELVREILIIYWYISTTYKIYDASKMLDYLDQNNQKTLEVIIQIFIKTLHVTDYDSFYSKICCKLIQGQTDIISDEDIK